MSDIGSRTTVQSALSSRGTEGVLAEPAGLNFSRPMALPKLRASLGSRQDVFAEEHILLLSDLAQHLTSPGVKATKKNRFRGALESVLDCLGQC